MLRQMSKTLRDSGVCEQGEFSPESLRVCTDPKKPPLDTLLMMSNGGFLIYKSGFNSTLSHVKNVPFFTLTGMPQKVL